MREAESFQLLITALQLELLISQLSYSNWQWECSSSTSSIARLDSWAEIFTAAITHPPRGRADMSLCLLLYENPLESPAAPSASRCGLARSGPMQVGGWLQPTVCSFQKLHCGESRKRGDRSGEDELPRNEAVLPIEISECPLGCHGGKAISTLLNCSSSQGVQTHSFCSQ